MPERVALRTDAAGRAGRSTRGRSTPSGRPGSDSGWWRWAWGRATGSRSTARTAPSGCWPTSARQGIGAATVGIYPTSPAAEVEYLMRHSGAVVLIVEDEEQLDKVLAVRDRLPRSARDRRHRHPGANRHLGRPDGDDVRRARGARSGHSRSTPGRASVAAHRSRRDARSSSTPRARPVRRRAPCCHTATCSPPRSRSARHSRAHRVDEVLSYLPLCHIAERLNSVINASTSGTS